MSLCVSKLTEVSNYPGLNSHPAFRGKKVSNLSHIASDKAPNKKNNAELIASAIGWALLLAGLVYAWTSSIVELIKEKKHSETEIVVPETKEPSIPTNTYFED